MSKGNEKIGSTLKGIGPAYMDKTGRNGLCRDLLDKNFTTQYIKLRMKHQRLLIILISRKTSATGKKNF
jgi:adenylosuccinate synthase